MGSGYVFSSSYCIASVRNITAPEYFTNGYCVGNILTQIFAIIALIYISCLFIWHMNAIGWGQFRSWTRTKTWVFILLFLFELIVVIRYTFDLYTIKGYAILLSIG